MEKFSTADKSRLLYLLLVEGKSVPQIAEDMQRSETEINQAIGRMKAQVTKKENRDKGKEEEE
jgi:transposase